MTEARRTQVQRSATTRQALVDASRPLFAAGGFGAVSTEAIVRAAGVTRGAMYHHFTDKTELFAAVFEAVELDLMQRMAAAVGDVVARGDTDFVTLMKFGAGMWLDACVEPEVHRIALVDAPAVLGWERWRDIGSKYGMGLVQGLIEQGIAGGALPPQPAAPLAHVLVGALDEAALYVSRADDPASARLEIGLVVDRLIEGLAA